MTIYDLVVSQELKLYWEAMANQRAPYFGETLWPNDKKLGLDLKWLKGSKGLPVVLKLSAFDTKAIPRDRLSLEKLSTEMPFFKESLLVDEEMRQELNKVLETKNQAYIDAVINKVFGDQISLIEGAAATRERMRMMLLTTGTIAMESNGQSYFYDYGLPEDHKVEPEVTWSDAVNCDPIEDMRAWMDKIEEDTGERPVRGTCSRRTWGYIRNAQKVVKSLFVLSNGQATVSDARLKSYLLEELGLELYVNSKKYKDETLTTRAFIPDGTLVLFPVGTLGNTWFGTTPEESDLLGSQVANVAITDTGVAITTMKQTDPVNVETKVTMVCLPSFEAADKVLIADVEASS